MKHKIYTCIEKDDKIITMLMHRTNITDWQQFTRTHFNLIAKEINKTVSSLVIENPMLISEFLLIGKDKVENIILDYQFGSIDDVIEHLDLTAKSPFNWISGKTLERYWKVENVKPKDLKLNVLLTYLGVPINDWDDWKYYSKHISSETEKENQEQKMDINEQPKKNIIFFNNLKNYYLGSYYLYYLKTDNNQRLIKTPFVIKLENNVIVIESSSEGQRYRSTVVKRMQNSLHVSCRNLDWDEDEIYLFNIGLERKPEVIFGVSITLTGKGSIPVAIKNILIKQSDNVASLDSESEKEISLKKEIENKQELAVSNYFKKENPSQLLFGEYSLTLEEFEDLYLDSIQPSV